MTKRKRVYHWATCQSLVGDACDCGGPEERERNVLYRIDSRETAGPALARRRVIDVLDHLREQALAGTVRQVLVVAITDRNKGRFYCSHPAPGTGSSYETIGILESIKRDYLNEITSVVCEGCGERHGA